MGFSDRMIVSHPIDSNIYSRRITAILKSEIAGLRKKGAVFVLTADEWSWRRKRFLGE